MLSNIKAYVIRLLTITDGGSLARALKAPISLSLKRLLIERRDQLDGHIEGEVRFIVVQPGDSLEALERELGFSVFQNVVDGRCFGDPEFGPSCEILEDHGHCWEMVFLFDDSGFAHVVLVRVDNCADRIRDVQSGAKV